MNILFVDFDGVLNSKQHILALKEMNAPGKGTTHEADLEFMKMNVNPNNMWVLKYALTQVSDLQVVISSSWRNHFEMEQFKELFRHYGLNGERIIGKTPQKMSSQRSTEINMWLDDATEPVKWLAIDDHPIFDLMDGYKQFEILTEPWVGMTMWDAFRIIRYFKPDFEEPFILI